MSKGNFSKNSRVKAKFLVFKVFPSKSYFLNMKQLDHLVVLPSISLGMLSVAVLNLNNMRDIESDKKAGKITVAVKLGLNKAKVYHYFLVGGALFTALTFFLLYYTNPFNALFLLAFIPILIHIKIVAKSNNPSTLDGQLKVLALSTFLFSLLTGVGYII